MTKILNQFCNLMRTAREKTGISKYRLAKTAKISDGKLASYETGEINVTIKTANKILIALNEEMVIGDLNANAQVSVSEFSQVVKKKRLKNELSINELGRLIGKSAATVAYWEKGNNVNPTIDIADRVLKLFGISMVLGAKQKPEDIVDTALKIFGASMLLGADKIDGGIELP